MAISAVARRQYRQILPNEPSRRLLVHILLRGEHDAAELPDGERAWAASCAASRASEAAAIGRTLWPGRAYLGVVARCGRDLDVAPAPRQT